MTQSSVSQRSANLLGAFALRVVDEMVGVTTAASGRPVTDTTALVALRSALAEGSQDQLAAVLGVTASGCARLVDRLAREGLVERGPGRDQRTVALRLTAAGRAAAEDALVARSASLHDALDHLDDTEQQQLTTLLERLLSVSTHDRREAFRTCRLCDLSVCHQRGSCPVTRGADEDDAQRSEG